jgi:hypothetical protein
VALYGACTSREIRRRMFPAVGAKPAGDSVDVKRRGAEDTCAESSVAPCMEWSGRAYDSWEVLLLLRPLFEICNSARADCGLEKMRRGNWKRMQRQSTRVGTVALRDAVRKVKRRSRATLRVAIFDKSPLPRSTAP